MTGAQIEWYDQARYFTATGQHLEGTPLTIEDRTDELEELYWELFSPERKKTPPKEHHKTSKVDCTDEDLIERARAAKNGDKFARLWEGDWSEYTSQSEAELALLCMLAFWTGCDAEWMDRLFRQSGLYRTKWERKDYRDRTIQKAIETVGDRESATRSTTATQRGNDQDLTRDYGHADVLSVLFRDQYRWAAHMGSWMKWNGKRSEPVPQEVVAKEAADALRREYARQLDATTDRATMREISKKVAEICTYARVTGALAFLRGWPGFITKAGDWDRDPWLLNVNNGTLDLRTGRLRPHDPGDLITKLAPVDYDPSAVGTSWNQHVKRFLPNPNVRRQVQRSLGRALVGSVLTEELAVWYGTGGNGKTTTARALQCVLGDYADRAAPNLLIHSKYERHPTEIADLAGKRLVFSVEVDQGKQLAEALVKELTGGDRKKGRFMRQDFFSFEQSFDIVLLVNHKPIITGSDDGIWRRIKLVPWEVRISEKERRPQDEVVSELVAEGSAVLNWLLVGLWDWQDDNGWTAPEVQAASEQYRAEMDLLSDFLMNCCELRPTYKIAKGELYKAYVEWCSDNDETTLPPAQFTPKLVERGIGERRTGKTRFYVGIRLRTNGDPQVTDGDRVSISPHKNSISAGDMERVSPPVTPDSRPIQVSDLVLLLSQGQVLNETPWRVIGLEDYPDGKQYAFFSEMPGGWPVSDCELVKEDRNETVRSDFEFEVSRNWRTDVMSSKPLTRWEQSIVTGYLGQLAGWPMLKWGKNKIVPAGKDGWEQFTERASVTELESAFGEILDLLESTASGRELLRKVAPSALD